MGAFTLHLTCNRPATILQAHKHSGHCRHRLRHKCPLLFLCDAKPCGYYAGRERCLRVLWQPPSQAHEPAAACKDANDVLMLYGIAAVQQCIEQARPLPVDGPFK